MTSLNDTSKRHINSLSDISQKSVETIGIFQNPTEKAFYACAQKVEKITAAIYLVTEVMDPNLPLTGKMRDCALGVLSACYGLLDGNLNARNVATAIVKIEEVMSLVGVGKIAHHLSEMNADVIASELGKVRDILTGEHAILIEKQSSYQPSMQGNQSALSRQIFSDAQFDQVSRERELIHTIGKPRSEAIGNREGEIKTTFKTTSLSDMSDRNGNQNDMSDIKTTSKTTSEFITVTDTKSEILSFIKSNGVTSLSDIKRVLPELSDKTLQRNLMKLIELKLIIREGNKRWTTYRIAK